MATKSLKDVLKKLTIGKNVPVKYEVEGEAFEFFAAPATEIYDPLKDIDKITALKEKGLDEKSANYARLLGDAVDTVIERAVDAEGVKIFADAEEVKAACNNNATHIFGLAKVIWTSGIVDEVEAKK